MVPIAPGLSSTVLGWYLTQAGVHDKRVVGCRSGVGLTATGVPPSPSSVKGAATGDMRHFNNTSKTAPYRLTSPSSGPFLECEALLATQKGCCPGYVGLAPLQPFVQAKSSSRCRRTSPLRIKSLHHRLRTT